MRRALRRSLLVVTCALAVSGLAAGAAEAFSWVSYPALVAQIRSGPMIRVIVNRTGGDVEIKFRNLYEWKARFVPAQQASLVALVHERHIPLKFAARPHARRKPAAVHHHLRYIAAGILAAAALVALGALLFRRRARRRGEPDGHGVQRAAG